MAVEMDEKKLVEQLDGIKSNFEETSKKMIDRINQQDEEIKKYGGTMTETSKAIKALEEKLQGHATNYDELKKLSEEIAVKLGRPGAGDMGKQQQVKSLGEAFVNSQAYKDFQKQGYPRTMQSGFELPRIGTKREVPLGAPVDMKAAIGDGVTGGLSDLRNQFATERLLEIMAQPIERYRVKDLFPVIPTVNGSIDYIRETGFVNNAEAQEETDTKGQSSFEFTQENVSVKTIAHWTPVARQTLEDIPALQTYMDTRLNQGLKIKEDAELLYGDGMGKHILGMLATGQGLQTYAWSDGFDKDTRIDAVRRAMTRVRIAQYDSTGVVLNPFDWEYIELAKDSQDRYLWVVVTQGGEQRLWRLPVVDTTAMVKGDFLVGAFAMGAAIWDRQQVTVRVTDSHDDFFVRNIIVILVEERLALTVYRPEAFVHGTFDQTPQGGGQPDVS